MSTSYKIISWDGIISGTNIPLTSVTIVPDLQLLEILEKNTNNMLQVKISGTNSAYDNIWMGLFDKSANVPNCRKNFFDQTGYWIVTINCPWTGQPTGMGSLEIVNGPYDTYNNYFNQVAERYTNNVNPMIKTSFSSTPSPAPKTFDIQNFLSNPKLLLQI